MGEVKRWSLTKDHQDCRSYRSVTTSPCQVTDLWHPGGRRPSGPRPRSCTPRCPPSPPAAAPDAGCSPWPPRALSSSHSASCRPCTTSPPSGPGPPRSSAWHWPPPRPAPHCVPAAPWQTPPWALGTGRNALGQRHPLSQEDSPGERRTTQGGGRTGNFSRLCTSCVARRSPTAFSATSGTIHPSAHPPLPVGRSRWGRCERLLLSTHPLGAGLRGHEARTVHFPRWRSPSLRLCRSVLTAEQQSPWSSPPACSPCHLLVPWGSELYPPAVADCMVLMTHKVGDRLWSFRPLLFALLRCHCKLLPNCQ